MPFAGSHIQPHVAEQIETPIEPFVRVPFPQQCGDMLAALLQQSLLELIAHAGDSQATAALNAVATS